MRLGFIGAGNMAGAMLRGFIEKGGIAADTIFIYDAVPSVAQNHSTQLGVNSVQAAAQVVQQADIIFLAVKPQVLPTVMAEIKQEVSSGKTFVSIAAGTTLANLAQGLGTQTPVIRVMPNVNMLVGASISAICPNQHVPQPTADYVYSLLETVGKATWLPEKDFAIFTAIAGCSPAYAYVFIDAMARTAVEYGLPKAQATEIAAQAVLGSALTLLQSGETPWQLVDKVCSPGGTTIAGLAALQDHAFPAVVAKGIRAAYNKDIQMQSKPKPE